MRLLLSILIVLTSLKGIAQYDMEDQKEDKEKKERKLTPFEIKKRTYVGGEFSLLFGNRTLVYVSPIVGFDILPTEQGGLSAGFSTMYQYYREAWGGAVFQTHAYGGGIFVRYRPLRPLLLQTEFNLYNTDDFVNIGGPRVTVPAFMAGGGYAGNLGERAYYQFMLMYDFINNPNNPLPPIICYQDGSGNVSCIPLYLRYGLVFYLG